MSVKSKVKRCNKEIKRLEDELKLIKQKLEVKLASEKDNKLLENIVKCALTNHIGGLCVGMEIGRREVDKMEDLKLDIEYRPEFNSYIIRTYYEGRKYNELYRGRK